jgi:hypothetical protein
MTLPTSPLEIWNSAFHSYESIPDSPSSSERPNSSTRQAYYYNNSKAAANQARSERRRSFLIIAVLSVQGMACLGLFAYIGADYTEALSHQEKTLPTLLSVVDPETNTYIYVLMEDHPVYRRLREANILEAQDSALQDYELPTLLLDKTQIQIDESITLTWTMGRDRESGNIMIQEQDIIALYCGDEDSDGDEDNSDGTFLEAATISQIRATSVKHGGHNNAWFIPSFPILRQDVCHFRLYSTLSSVEGSSSPSPSQQLVHIASSDDLEISLAHETPTAIHLALSDDPSKMVVQFTTGHVPGTTPVVRIVKAESTSSWGGQNKHVLFQGKSDTYTPEDMCQSPANQTEAGKFYPPGMLHAVELKHLEPDTRYQYQVGLLLPEEASVLVWSDASTFTSAPTHGDTKEFSYIVYGDQGCPYLGWAQGQEWLAAMMERENPTSIHHFGDISYAQGAAHIWDGWFQMIRPFASRIPLMIGIGNHEYDHTHGGGPGKDPSGVETSHGFMPSWGNFADDSGGECGVTMSKRFQMPSSEKSNGVFWYSYNYASVHTIVISSEHDLSSGSPQYEFFEADLKNVDRKITPWVVVESHRPLYEGEGGRHWWPSKLVGEAMRDEFEDLLKDHNVDLVLAGHYHQYHRTCDGLYKGRCDRGGPTHITIGSAGGKLDETFIYANPWTSKFIRGEFGYGRITVANDTHLNFEFVRHGDMDDLFAGEIHDDIWIHRDRA